MAFIKKEGQLARLPGFCVTAAISLGLVSLMYAQENVTTRTGASVHAPATPAPVNRVPRRGQRSTPAPNQAALAARKQPNNRWVAPVSYAEALRRYRRERHSQMWWRQHFTTIVLVGGGYYYLDAGYWCPAWGYDPTYEYYDYDGPIYTYGNLLPDQVIVNVQKALAQLGYYSSDINGSLSSATRAAIAAYQKDAGLEITAVIDGPTVAALGLD